MGVPVVSLVGARHAARVGASLLTAAGLADCWADSPQTFVEIARHRAAGIAGVRASLRQQIETSPLCDAAGFTRGLEAALLRLCAD